jgi:hypothetical protein
MNRRQLGILLFGIAGLVGAVMYPPGWPSRTGQTAIPIAILLVTTSYWCPLVPQFQTSYEGSLKRGVAAVPSFMTARTSTWSTRVAWSSRLPLWRR